MIRLLNKEQAYHCDQETQKREGLSSEDLMDRAGSLCFQRLLDIIPLLKKKKILILVGPGNNGGDGLVIASRLLREFPKVDLEIWYQDLPEDDQSLVSKKRKSFVSEFSAKQPDRLIKPLSQLATKELKSQVSRFDLILDCVFGIGLSKPISENWAHLFDSINLVKKTRNIIIVAIDIPSGLDSNSGQVLGSALRANHTFSIGSIKVGCYLAEGAVHAGQIHRIDIGFKKVFLNQKWPSLFLMTTVDAAKLLKLRRPAQANKYISGQLHFIGGGRGMEGALTLCLEAAARTGAGYLTYTQPEDAEKPIQLLPDFIEKKWPSQTRETFKLFPSSSGGHAIVVGPGLGRNSFAKNLFHQFLSSFLGPEYFAQNQPWQGLETSAVILDADALYFLGEWARSEKIIPKLKNCLLTPHSGEAAQLLGVTSREVDADRITALLKLTHKFGCSVLLKGNRTLIGEGSRVWVIPAGGPALAQAGTGDVLSGMIGALAARGLALAEAARLGAFLHGLIADLYCQQTGLDFGLLASDLKNYLPYAMKYLKSKTI